MFVNYGDKVNQTKSHFKQQKKPINVDFIGFLYVVLFYFSEDKVQGDKVVKESISISFMVLLRSLKIKRALSELRIS